MHYFKNILIIWALIPSILWAAPSFAEEKPENLSQQVGVNPQLGKLVNTEVKLVDESGKTHTLKELLAPGKPTVLIPAYYDCPRLCGLLLRGALTLFNEMDLILGNDYQVLTVSFDPTEGPEKAAQRAKEYRSELAPARVGTADSWKFFVGAEPEVKGLMNDIGFTYAKDGEDYSHTAAIIILTPQGEISQYFTGVDFSPWDVRLALIDASKGSIGSAIDHILLYCFRFDPTKGKYTWAAFNVMRAGGILTLIAIAGFYYFLVFSRKRRSAV